jgi:hypothetical protein
MGDPAVLVDRHPVRDLGRKPVHVHADRVVELQLGALCQLCHRHGGEQLGDRGQAEQRVGPVGHRPRLVGHAMRTGQDGMRVLLVEDEQPLAAYIAAGLRKHGFAVDLATGALAASTRPRGRLASNPRCAGDQAGDTVNMKVDVSSPIFTLLVHAPAYSFVQVPP